MSQLIKSALSRLAGQKKERKGREFRRFLENTVVESYGYNLMEGIHSDLMF
ncbi:MAG: hypothetical protein II721_05315 [Bacilli bacterium]|nr:hypothetical protein [Bacilli bacterium]